jgi:signal transduction histidine kinase
VAIKADANNDGGSGAGGVQIAVSDTGIGITPENQSHIFDEFWQLSDPQRSKGSGLGLSISKRLMEAMGGTIAVHSDVGKGSTFTITLPAASIMPRPDPDNLTAAANS